MNHLIIGASEGIGHSLSQILSNEGHTVWAAQRKIAPHLPQQQQQIFDVLGGTFNLDALPDALHGFAYCPGTINLKPFHRFSDEEFKYDFEINVLGAVRCIRALLPKLKKGNASIVLFSSVAAGTGMPFHSSIASAKAAIEGLTKSLAAEFAPLMRVNAVAPSLTETTLAAKLLADDSRKEAAQKRHPLQKYAQPHEIASLAAMLLNQQAGFITGQIFKADGGISSLKL